MIQNYNLFSAFNNVRRNFTRITLWLVIVYSVLIPQILFAQGGVADQNHYKVWMTLPQQYQATVLVEDQFMKDSMLIQGIEMLSNPTYKNHEGIDFPILNPDQHLTWYRAVGRDTSINLAYKNQFESTAVTISNAEYLLVPTQKYGHVPPVNLDHYKAYRITQSEMLHTPVILNDQFDMRIGLPENIDSLVPTFFLTPAIKNQESPLYDSVTHYVAYMIFPPRMVDPMLWEYQTWDQFGEHYLQIMHSLYLLVPSEKILPAPPETGMNHYKTWRTEILPFQVTVNVQDQFMTDDLQLMAIECLSNPVKKMHDEKIYNISKPDDHLTWYRAHGRDTMLMVEYVNQYESTAVVIGSTEYLLLPTQKMPHPIPESLDHYKAYQIINPKAFATATSLEDQFDLLLGSTEVIDSLRPLYFLTPAMKNYEPMYDTVTHYVAYEIFPKEIFQYPVTTNDQFGEHNLAVFNSDILLVPAKKLSVSQPPDSLLGSLCGVKCEDLNANGICDQGEPLLANWSISLASGSGGIVSVLTNAAGAYCFTGLMPGQYTISETVQPGWIQTGPTPPGTYAISLLPGQQISGLDFANIKIPQSDTLVNHYKTWRTMPLAFEVSVRVEDQFMTDSLQLVGIEFLSNPVKKVHLGAIFDIVDPDDHLTWYNAIGRDTLLRVSYVNQFESTAVRIGSPGYLLVPAQKQPHGLPDSVDHYKAYRIENAPTLISPFILEDQFDNIFGVPQQIDSIKAMYFLTPASKNMETMYDPVTHYVAYDIFYRQVFQYPVTAVDQFGSHELMIENSELVLVPTKKLSVSQPYDTVSFGVNAGWNMRSVPLVMDDFRKSVLFPSAISDAFAYEGSYVSKDTLTNGVGYWLKFSAAEAINMIGSEISALTISVLNGWNLIGTISEPIPVASISSIPGGIITSQFFEYVSAYQSVDTLKPGMGYWVKVSQDGQLVLSGTKAAASNRIRIVPTSEYPPLPPEVGESGVDKIPEAFSLGKNYPNPFNPLTLISYQLPVDSRITISIYDILGQEIGILYNGFQTAGYHTMTWDAGNHPTGVYYCRMTAPGFVQTSTLMLVR